METLKGILIHFSWFNSHLKITFTGGETNGSEALERLRLQLQHELFLDAEGDDDGTLEDAGGRGGGDYDDIDNELVDEEFNKLKFKMEAEKEVMKLK